MLVALPYLLASYYAQGAFKETILAALVLAFTVELRELERDGRLSCARGCRSACSWPGAIAAYTYPAMLWFGAITVAAGAVALVQSRFERTPLAEHFTVRNLAACAAGAAAILAVALLPEGRHDRRLLHGHRRLARVQRRDRHRPTSATSSRRSRSSRSSRSGRSTTSATSRTDCCAT